MDIFIKMNITCTTIRNEGNTREILKGKGSY